MDKNFGRIFGAGLAVVLVIIALVFFAKRGDHLAPEGSVLKERSIELNETNSLLLLDIRLVNDSNVTMTVSEIGMSVELADGTPVTGNILPKSDLDGTFKYFPLLGDKFNESLVVRDEIPPHSKVDSMISASFAVPLAMLDARKKVTLRVQDASGAAAELSGK